MKTFFIAICALLFLSACDNSVRVSFELESSTVLETDGTALISVSLNRSSQTGPSDVNAPNSVGNQEVRVSYTVSGTAIFGTNHRLPSGVIVFPSKSKRATIRVPVLHHTEFDGDCTVILSLGEPEGGKLGTVVSHTLTIQEVDIAPKINFSLSTQSVSESAGVVQLGVNLEYASEVNAQAELTFSGTAHSGVDFSASTSVTILAGQISANIPITLLDNLTVDGDKTLVVTLTNPQGAILGNTNSFLLTIVDDDNQPTVSFSKSTQTVSESAGTITVGVTMSKTYSLDVTIPYTVSGTASQPEDHNLVSGSFVVLAGDSTASFSIVLNNDALDENDETITLSMGTLINGNPGTTTTQTITITDDDPSPTVQFSTATQSVSEGVGTVTIRANLSGTSGRSVTVPYTIAGSATSPADHSLVNGTIIVTPGSSFGTTSFTIVNDSLYEGNETITVTMGVPVGATASGVTSQIITISENDPMPQLSFETGAQNISEGNSGQATVTVQVNLSAASGINTTIPFSWSGSASSGLDYSPQTISPLSIPAGSTSTSISFHVLGDTMYESNETLVINLGSPTGASLGNPSTYTATLTNEDPLPEIYFNGQSSSVSEGAGLFVINVLATNTHESTMNIPYTVAGTATNPGDHNLSSGNIILTTGNSIGNLSFNLQNDTIVEANETVVVTLGNPTNASLGSPSVFTVTINDNDRGFTLDDTLLWMDVQHGLYSSQPGSYFKWEPRYSDVSGNCGLGEISAEKIKPFWKDWFALMIEKFESKNFYLDHQEGGALFLVEKSGGSFPEPPKIEETYARHCGELVNMIRAPLAELIWVKAQGMKLSIPEVVKYLESKYSIGGSE